MNRSSFQLFAGIIALSISVARGADVPPVDVPDAQPFFAQVRRVIEATDYLGAPIAPTEKQALAQAMQLADSAAAVRNVQAILDRHCLFLVGINPEMRVKAAQGPAKAELVEQGWRQFLVKVHNEAGTTAPFRAVSPNALSVHNANIRTESDRQLGPRDRNAPLPDGADLWLDLQTRDAQPLQPTLGGLAVEYRIVQLYSRDAGQREAKISFNVGQGTQDLGFRNEADVLFTCLPAREVALRVRDENDQPAVASFLIRDKQGRVYPSQAKRLAPDFPFHPQIYRGDNETIRLPDGDYTIEFARGPESIPETRAVTIGEGTRELAWKVRRWIDPSQLGWWSGDHHIHAAGCAHYTKPSEGVHALDMARHCRGEDLKIGANLTWGPCFDYQKQFFTGAIDQASQYPYLLRYDVEVSGFGSHRSGHLVLLRLRDQIYPGGDSSAHWPTLCLSTLRWAKKQGAVCGPAHSGWGLQPVAESELRPGGSNNAQDLKLATRELPNYVIPPFNGIGANEYIVDVTHEVEGPDGKPVPAVDFLSMVDTPHTWELNIWYHTLNAGFRTRISGETDFPCIYGERVGLGRSYVKLDGKLDYDQWCEGIRNGRNYVSDGRSHLMEFKANGVALGENGSELRLEKSATIKLTAKVAARLGEIPHPEIQKLPAEKKPYWDIERARIGDSREVPVEVVVNGFLVARKTIVADGTLRDVSFDVPIEKSSWVALRILASSHTNPIFVIVDGKPIRPSRRSVDWCLRGVDQCWSQKEKLIAPAELDDARAAYEHARNVYRQRLAECVAE
ncbi:MAG TPA: CehA/McbA family metallohydrolase [Chthoniobacteraceae bacterium]|nr:CehA/McbA family metallohydrolase [Chthoniobacteraceae bacterium]